MGTPIKKTQTEYVTVYIRDGQNNAKKAYQFPDNTIFETTNTCYHFSSKEGVREFCIFTDDNGDTLKGYKGHLTDNTIDVIYPQYVALDELDVNKDNRFDYHDIDNAKTFKQHDDGGYEIEESLANYDINERLSNSKSNYRVGDEWGPGVYLDKEDPSVEVNFFDVREPHNSEKNKQLRIFLPKK